MYLVEKYRIKCKVNVLSLSLSFLSVDQKVEQVEKGGGGFVCVCVCALYGCVLFVKTCDSLPRSRSSLKWLFIRIHSEFVHQLPEAFLAHVASLRAFRNHLKLSIR